MIPALEEYVLWEYPIKIFYKIHNIRFWFAFLGLNKIYANFDYFRLLAVKILFGANKFILVLCLCIKVIKCMVIANKFIHEIRDLLKITT